MSSGGTGTMSAPHGRDVSQQQIQKMLDENAQLIKTLVENQNMKGKSMDIIQYQQTLHRNLVYLASLADPRLDIHAILPPPGSSLLQSQRAPLGSQNATPPPPSSTGTGRMVQGPSSQQQWTHMSRSPLQAQYNMKGYAPAPWLAQGPMTSHSGPTGVMYSPSIQQQMQLDEHRRRMALRMHQEQLIQAQARRMQQVSSQQATGGGIPGMPVPQQAMYPSVQPQGPGTAYMGGGPGPSMNPMGPYPQPGAVP